MVLKFGIDQIPRAQWTWIPYDENWISANYVNPGEPDGDHIIKNGEKKFNYGFNDFVVVECTPEIAYQVHGNAEKDAQLPPKHPRASSRKTVAPEKERFEWNNPLKSIIGKHKSGYATMAYGWGDHANVLDSACTTNKYVDIEGPEADDMYGDVFVKFIPLLIPGGLAKNDTFWIDLNKGVRALYFPARYVYHPDAPDDAGYAKISFVDTTSPKLIDAKNLIFENTKSKALAKNPINLEGITRKTSETIQLNKEYHVGAYSFDSTLIVNVPKFIAASYYVAGGASQVENPHDALYLAKSADIKATRLADPGHWILPPSEYGWEKHTKHLMRSYASEIGRMDQANLEEVTKESDLGAGQEFFLNVLVMASTLIPYVGPLISTLSAEGVEALKGLRKDSSPEEAKAAGISTEIWGALPGEAKEKIAPKIAEAATKLLKYARRS